MASSISAARQALYSALTTAARAPGALEGVQVTFGYPDDNQEQEVVAILGITAGDEATAGLGPAAKREESYRIEVAVKVYDPATEDARTVDTRGFDLYEAVREVVTADVTLSGTVRTAYPVNPRSDGPVQPTTPEGKRLAGWVIRIDSSIECHARA